MKSNIWLGVVMAVVIGVAAFFGGMKYAQTQSRSSIGMTGQFGRFRQGNGGNGFPGQGRNGNIGRVAGQILSIDAQGLTVKMPDGSSRVIILSDSTQYVKSTAGSKSDLKTGDRVGVFGTMNSDGSVTATEVQINPQFPASSPSAVQR